MTKPTRVIKVLVGVSVVAMIVGVRYYIARLMRVSLAWLAKIVDELNAHAIKRLT